MLLMLLHENKKEPTFKKIFLIQEKHSVLHSAKIKRLQDLSNCFELRFTVVITGF